jgi:uncharacterized membrane protein YozB (DUF420 family)
MLDRLLINFHTALMLATLMLTSITLGIYLGRDLACYESRGRCLATVT